MVIANEVKQSDEVVASVSEAISIEVPRYARNDKKGLWDMLYVYADFS